MKNYTLAIGLLLVIPCGERGKNGGLSFSRERVNVYYIDTADIAVTTAITAAFHDNVNSIAYMRVIGIKIFERLAKSGKITKLNNEPLNIVTDGTNNGGYMGENTIYHNFPYIVKANKIDDRNGIDCYIFERPAQIKTVSHGIDERINYMISERKKSGVSVINGSVKTLIDIVTTTI